MDLCSGLSLAVASNWYSQTKASFQIPTEDVVSITAFFTFHGRMVSWILASGADELPHIVADATVDGNVAHTRSYAKVEPIAISSKWKDE